MGRCEIFETVITMGSISLLSSLASQLNVPKDKLLDLINSEHEFLYGGTTLRTNVLVISILQGHLHLVKWMMGKWKLSHLLLCLYTVTNQGMSFLTLRKSWNAFLLGVFLGDMELLQIFHDAGIRLVDRNHREFLWAAVAGNVSVEKIQWLIDHGLRPEELILQTSTKNGNLPQFELLLNSSISSGKGAIESCCKDDKLVQFTSLIISRKPQALENDKLLFTACRHGSLKNLELLIATYDRATFLKHSEHMIPFQHAKDSNKPISCLAVALLYKHYSCALELIRAGCSSDVSDFDDCLREITNQNRAAEFLPLLMKNYDTETHWKNDFLQILVGHVSKLGKRIGDLHLAIEKMQTCTICTNKFGDGAKRKNALQCGHCLCATCVARLTTYDMNDSNDDILVCIKCQVCQKVNNSVLDIFDDTDAAIN